MSNSVNIESARGCTPFLNIIAHVLLESIPCYRTFMQTKEMGFFGLPASLFCTVTESIGGSDKVLKATGKPTNGIFLRLPGMRKCGYFALYRSDKPAI
jgi:hypothetical protein